uniref:Uncharacterized protein n=1 Tax=Rhizophora mucronata TaxID=61149 RepID=A0A2P2NPV3_RHIMU
MWTATQYL